MYALLHLPEFILYQKDCGIPNPNFFVSEIEAALSFGTTASTCRHSLDSLCFFFVIICISSLSYPETFLSLSARGSRCHSDPNIYTKKVGNHLIILVLYVDDLILTSSDPNLIVGNNSRLIIIPMQMPIFIQITWRLGFTFRSAYLASYYLFIYII